MRLLFNRRIALIRLGRWTLYFPSTFRFGRACVEGLFKNWSILYVTLEHKAEGVTWPSTFCKKQLNTRSSLNAETEANMGMK